MGKKIFIISFLLLLNGLVSLSQQIRLTGRVVRIADGDTITILDHENKQVKIRLYGIDCPENGQNFSNVAKKFTSEKCFGNTVAVEVKDVDRYGRMVGIVLLPDSRVLNKELLKAGLAWHYKYFDDSEELAQLETEARANKIGIWSHKNPVAPWEYRRNK